MAKFAEIWKNMSGGQQQAVGQKVWLAGGGEKGGEETIKKLLEGDLEITFRDASKTLVDQNGRCIPPSGMVGIVDANYNYQLSQPKIDYVEVLHRLERFFSSGLQFVSAMDFEARSKAVLAYVGEQTQVKNLRNGVYLPFCLPKLNVTDYGRTLEEVFLAAVERSYLSRFPDRTFVNYRKGDLIGQVSVVAESRHNELIEAMRLGPVVGVLFPMALQGFGIEADREMIAQFPVGYRLTGAIDFAAAYVAYPETLARDGNTPVSDCAALSWQDPGFSLFLFTSDNKIRFDSGILDASPGFSAGVVFLG